MFEIIAVTSMTATGRGYFNFWICRVHVSTLVEVDTMVLRIFDHCNMTWLPAYAVRAWRNHGEHRAGQAEGRAAVFADYRICVAQVLRDYTLTQRHEAPHNSNAALLAPHTDEPPA